MPIKEITKSEFNAMPPRHKGYAVYMGGCRDDQPNIPRSFTPEPKDAVEYHAGYFAASLEAQDEG